MKILNNPYGNPEFFPDIFLMENHVFSEPFPRQAGSMES